MVISVDDDDDGDNDYELDGCFIHVLEDEGCRGIGSDEGDYDDGGGGGGFWRWYRWLIKHMKSTIILLAVIVVLG